MTACSDIGPRIRAAREALGWTQVELAKRLKVGMKTVSGWENGHRYPTRKLTLLESVLGVRLTDDPPIVLVRTELASLSRDKLLSLYERCCAEMVRRLRMSDKE